MSIIDTDTNQSIEQLLLNRGANEQHLFLLNAFTSRVQLMKNLLDPRRDIDAECGYSKEITLDQYTYMYRRNGIAQRVVDIWPDESWVVNPDISQNEEEEQTEFEEAWQLLEEAFSLYSFMHRIDKLSGIGSFGVILLGIGDGKELNQPVEGVNDDGSISATGRENKLNFVRVFDQDAVDVASLETDEKNPRFGFPKSYNIKFENVAALASGTGTTLSITREVHWSRIVHIADNSMSSELFGVPRQEPVWNNLHNLRKIMGASGEGYYRGGFPGLSFEALPGYEKFDAAGIRDETEKYMNSLQRYIAQVGMTVKTLVPNIENPTPHFDMELQIISLTIKIPMRILLGSEQAQLASGQDKANLGKRVMTRQTRYLSPRLVRPFVDRLVMVGVLPAPPVNVKTGQLEYKVEWPDVNAPTDAEKADNAAKWVEAIAKYIQSGADMLILPHRFLTKYLDFSDAEAEEIVKESEERIAEEEEVEREAQEAAMKAAGIDPANPMPPVNGKPSMPPKNGKAPVKKPFPVRS